MAWDPRAACMLLVLYVHSSRTTRDPSSDTTAARFNMYLHAPLVPAPTPPPPIMSALHIQLANPPPRPAPKKKSKKNLHIDM